MKWDKEIDRLQREQVEAFIGKLNETRSMVGLLPLPAYQSSFHGYCCSPSEEMNKVQKEFERNFEESFSLGDRIDDICSKCKELSDYCEEDIEMTKPVYYTTNITINCEHADSLVGNIDGLTHTIYNAEEDDSDEC